MFQEVYDLISHTSQNDIYQIFFSLHNAAILNKVSIVPWSALYKRLQIHGEYKTYFVLTMI